MAIGLYDYQLEAVSKLKNGSILCGGVGSGKSRTGIGFYFLQNGGCFEPYKKMSMVPQDLYIITTARKRDSGEWLKDLAPYELSTDLNHSGYRNKVVIDSWNNIGKYKDIKNSFFLFDEQRVVGYGAWTKSFLNITKYNNWILLTATPGDCWSDYIPVFIANGFYKHKTDFERQHVVYNPRTKFPKIDRYVDQGKLIRCRNEILVNMDYQTKTERHDEKIVCDYDRREYQKVLNRWNPFDDIPIENAADYYYLLRRVVNSDPSRVELLIDLLKRHPRIIVFYNFDYELDILRNAEYPDGVGFAEWNGHKHEPVPTSDSWIYLVQYAAGAEAWNCTTTNAIVFYSQNYSYKVLVQAMGRIDRLNTPFHDLYYYRFKSNASIDYMIARALNNKRDFNERSHKNPFSTESRKKLPL